MALATRAVLATAFGLVAAFGPLAVAAWLAAGLSIPVIFAYSTLSSALMSVGA